MLTLDFYTFFHQCINSINTVLWSYILIFLLLATGIWFTLRFKFIQLSALLHSVWILCTAGKQGGDISPLHALTIGLASRVGTGNIAGVAVALTTGGPGAIFWMWVTALLGMSSAFVEATLAQIFKVPYGPNGFRGGPAYYIKTGLGSHFFGIAFAISLILAFGFVFNAVQSNSISDTFHSAFGLKRGSVGIITTAITALIIFGGIKRVARVSQIMVPFMAAGYLILAITVMVQHSSELYDVIMLIFRSAFGFEQAAGGFAGYAVSQAAMMGIKRGLFSNEAGMGSAPNAAAAASAAHPVTQGLLQMLGVFIDTIIICSATAFIILLSDAYIPGSEMQGSALTQQAVTEHFGAWGGIFLAVAVFFFAFSSIIGNYAYAEVNVEFVTKKKSNMFAFRVAVLVMVMFGSVGTLPLVWDMADTSMALMSIINLVAILLLGRYALLAWDDYKLQRKQGISEPVFSSDSIPEIKDKISNVW